MNKKTIIIIFLFLVIIIQNVDYIENGLLNGTYDNMSSQIKNLKNQSLNKYDHTAYTLDYTVKCENIKKISVERMSTKGKSNVNIDILPIYVNNTRSKILTICPNYVSIVYEDGKSHGMLGSSLFTTYYFDKDIYYDNAISIKFPDSISPHSYIVYNIPFNRIDLDKNPTLIFGITQYDRQGNYIDDDTIEIKLSGLEYIIV